MAQQALYRFWNSENQLLYVGISKTFYDRMNSHANHSAWVTQAVRTTIEWYDSRKEVEAAEKVAIQTEGPIYNKLHNPVYQEPRKHFYNLFDISLQPKDEYHVQLISWVTEFLSDPLIENISGTEEARAWAFANAIYEVSLSDDEVDVPCRACKKIMHLAFIEQGHASVCDASRGF